MRNEIQLEKEKRTNNLPKLESKIIFKSSYLSKSLAKFIYLIGTVIIFMLLYKINEHFTFEFWDIFINLLLLLPLTCYFVQMYENLC